MKPKFSLVQLFICIYIFIIMAGNAYAHPGRTDSSGGHTCRTNCEKWGLSYGEYHNHGGGGSSTSSSGSSSSTSTRTTTRTSTPAKPKPVITYRYIAVTEAIAFSTKREDDSTLEKGKEVVKQEGKAGIKTKTFKVTYTDGKETYRSMSKEEVTTQPINKIVLVGTKPKEEPQQEEDKKEDAKEVNEEDVVAASDSNDSDGNGFLGSLILIGLGSGAYLLYKKYQGSKG